MREALGELTADYSRGPPLIPWILISRSSRARTAAVCWRQRLEDARLLPLKTDRGPGTKEFRQPPEAGKEGNRRSLEPPQETRPADTLR